MIFNKTFTISPMDARNIALAEAGADGAVFTRQALMDGGLLYELDFTANGMCYSCYVDTRDGSVPGFLSLPDAA